MNAESISQWLRAVGVPDEVVSVGAEADARWCLLRTDAGQDGPAWEVFWREQGNRYDWASFSNEQVACFYLFGRLTWAQVARGAVGVLAGSGQPGDEPDTQPGADPNSTPAEDPDATPPTGIPLPGSSVASALSTTSAS
jgi:hypothetical protein